MPPTAATLTYQVDGVSQVVQLVGKTTLGRTSDCNVILPAQISGISRKHAIIAREGQEWHILDNGSLNGTFVNRMRLAPQQPQRLRNGDVINIGPLELLFHSSETAADRVDYEDHSPIPQGSIFISMKEVQRILAEPDAELEPAAAVQRSAAGSPRYSSLSALTATSAARGGDISWGVQLFTQVGQTLLAANDLEAMLENILRLVFHYVPSERGVICNYDEPSGQISPKAFRSLGAEAGQRLMISRNVINEAVRARSSILVADIANDSRFNQVESVKALRIKSAMCAPLLDRGAVRGLIYVDTQDTAQPFRQHHLEALTALAVFSGVAIEQARLRADILREQQIRQRLAKHHAPAVVEEIARQLAEGAQPNDMLAEDRDVTVLFCDICGFTSRAESLAPAEVVRFLNGVFERLVSAVFEFDGTLDKFIGDGMLAFFGAPLVRPDHAERAVQAALRMQQAMDEYNQAHPPAAGQEPVRIRVGINSGRVVVGEIGSSTSQRNYTVIGDAVNTASRIETYAAKPGQIVVGPATAAALASSGFTLVAQPKLRVKGKSQELETWLVISAQAIPSIADSQITASLPPGAVPEIEAGPTQADQPVFPPQGTG